MSETCYEKAFGNDRAKSGFRPSHVSFTLACSNAQIVECSTKSEGIPLRFFLLTSLYAVLTTGTPGTPYIHIVQYCRFKVQMIFRVSLSCATRNEAKLAVIKRLISFFEYVLTLKNCVDGFNIAIVREEQKSAWASPPSDFTPFLGNIQGRSQDFSKGRSQRLLTRSPSGDRRLYMVYTAAFPRDQRAQSYYRGMKALIN